MMKQETDLPQALRYPLRTEEIRAEGRREAFQFALECNRDVSCIKAEIEWYEDWFADPSDTQPGQPLAPGTSVRRHAEGYLAGLKDALAILSQAAEHSEDDAEPREIALRKEMIFAHGWRNAFQFALECGGDQSRIQSEFEYPQSELSRPSASSVGQPLATGVSVRRHIEGYLAGLKDALRILSQAEAEQTAMVKSIAEAPALYRAGKQSSSKAAGNAGRKSNGVKQTRKRTRASASKSSATKKRGIR